MQLIPTYNEITFRGTLWFIHRTHDACFEIKPKVARYWLYKGDSDVIDWINNKEIIRVQYGTNKESI